MINPDELIFCVDADNIAIEPQLKTYAHEKGTWHRNSHVWIHNGHAQILCHQRSTLVPTNKLKWEPFFGGHNAPHATELETAVTELFEETGLAVSQHDLNFVKLYKYLSGHEFISVYLLEFGGDLSDLAVEKEEVISLQWQSVAALREVYASKNSAWSYLEYEETILDLIPSNQG